MGTFVEGSAKLIENVLFAGGIGLLLFSVACFLLLFNERRTQRERLVEERHQALGLPPGQLVYENTDGLGEPITSDIHPLTGKPSYVVKLPNSLLLPIDIKPVAQNAMTPAPHHVLQLATYCLILEEYAEQAPTHGILRYLDREFTVEYTPALRKKVIRLLKEMDLCSAQQPPAIKKQKPAKCRACIYQPICPVGQGK
jgi:CRISPR/Cas system-associated exonuclease Cas4 (RecB family)